MVKCVEERKKHMVESLHQLLSDSKTRPFLFRTRFERTMIRVKSAAKETGNFELELLASNALEKLKSIIDKSNSTPDGVLRSFLILEPDIKRLLEVLNAGTESAGQMN